MVNQQRWLSLMSSVGIEQNLDTFGRLCMLYKEKHRRYHTLAHINATLNHLDTIKGELTEPFNIELALWFHDVIYHPFSSTNELDSANLAVQFINNNNLGTAVQESVFDLIMATQHSAIADSNDQAYLIDIDLSILGARTPVYQKYSKDIRFEYKRVPYFLYKSKRKEVLQSFLDRDVIYNTSFFRAKLETQSRVNIQAEIDGL